MNPTYKIYNDEALDAYLDASDDALAAICRRDTLARMELARRRHGLDGDIYFITPGNIISDAQSHLCEFPDSVATTIQEMAQEKINDMIAKAAQSMEA